MKQLKARARKLKHRRSIWNVLEFTSAWVIPGITGIGIGTGMSIIYDKPTQIQTTFLVTGLVGLLYQVILGLPAISFIDRKKTELLCQENELQKQMESVKEIHLQLDSYRDAMLFDQCNKYWELLNKLAS